MFSFKHKNSLQELLINFSNADHMIFYLYLQKNTMKIVIFAGGTGKRFWPVSRQESPKQFSPLISGKPLLRIRVDLLLKHFKPEDIFISTGKRYEKEVVSMMPEIPERNIILEPEMRDTGPAVTLAVAYIDSLYPGESISIQWSDHLIKKDDVFTEALLESDKQLKSSKDIGVVFITVPARFPSPHRGYIHFGDEINDYSDNLKLHKFIQFKEKPSKKVAEKYLADGSYGWNPGYWTLRAEFYLSKMKKLHTEVHDVCMDIVSSNWGNSELERFKSLEKDSADFMFAENVQKNEAEVMYTDMGWSDVGEWIALKEALEDSPESNVTKGNVIDLDSKDSIVFNLEEDKTVATIGLEGMVVVNTGDVLAIFHKEDNKRLKEFLKKLEDEGKTEYL